MTDKKTHHHDPTIYHYTFGPHNPVMKIASGDTVVTTTIDTLNFGPDGREIPRSMRSTGPSASFREVNPLTGPFYIEGAEPGDTLAVHILDISLTRDYVDGNAGYDKGGLSWGIAAGMSLAPKVMAVPRKEYRWRIDRKKGTATVDLADSLIGSVSIPMNPHFGCIGVAPDLGEFVSSRTPSTHGGNMDCVETGPGTTIYLPVFVPGALLCVGDVHAAQGDGELCGGGLDISAKVRFECSLRKGSKIGWPRLENKDYLMVAASARPLLDAYRLAQVELIKWLEDTYGYDPLDALHLITQIGESRIGNVVDPLFTVVAKFSKKYLPEEKSE